MSTYATAFALATAYALVVAAMLHAFDVERKAQLHRRDCALRVSAALTVEAPILGLPVHRVAPHQFSRN